MKISKVEIFNWRSIVHESIDFNDLMIFIGQNNHGKSNVLSALLFFFGEIGLQDLDFNNTSNELWIEIEFCNLNEEERSTFQKYVTSSNTIKVRKVAIKGEGFSYHGYLQEPNEDWLKEENISNYTTRETAQELPLYEYLPDSGRITKDLFRQAQTEYIQNHNDTISFEYKLESSNFLGAKNVAKGMFGDLFFIPSIKKASDELSTKGNSAFAQLYSRVINKMSESDPKFIEAKQKIAELSKILNKTTDDGKPNQDRPTDLTSLEILLDEELKSWEAKIDIQITPPNVDEIFRVGASVWVDDGIKTDVERKGHGLQRALIFALLRAWSRILKEERASVHESKQEAESGSSKSHKRKASKATYFIFEEPELFLHPQAQRELFSSLVALSKDENQIVLCTHSSSFLGLEYYKSICIVKKDSVSEGTKILQCTSDLFSELEEKKRFNLSYWINPDRSELFFAKKVILLEGPTEKSVIPLIAQKIGVFKFDYTLIDCGGKTLIPQYITLLNKFNLKYIAVYDKDHQAGKDQAAIDAADKHSNSIEQMIDSEIGQSVILENDIEEEIGLLNGGGNKPYTAINHVDDDSFQISETLKSKIEKIFE
ncbi:MAG: ATP-dependent endonuclease [Deltaproteobacteria bacterium]|nr:ATP-dependent endonuclease [Deltaproteobacteria bacterium]